jgi:dihydroorotate dehydrogenase (NAD+) catalytic subunit
VSTGWDAIELMLAGASAIQVGTASFADPRACPRVLREITGWCDAHSIADVASLSGRAHHR